jgi:hypothetical protein
LIIPCEVAVKSVIPAVKALMAQELVEKHDLKQNQVAEILGISQSAVSKYTRKVRGYVIKVDDLDEVKPLIEKMLDLIVSGGFERAEFLNFFCRACVVIRRAGLLCQFCEKADPKMAVAECGFCVTYNLASE